ncbi:hypothetical protein [Rhizobium leguminosarum]|uniref:hypothetical protein n=1 Tax=Rhizobium leguminosarum TaxID=384 RepID=UPI001FE047F5|nr:hypothetical protein [Rhizobium leguminosarum]
MAMPDQFFDLAHPAAEMVPTAAPGAPLHCLIPQQAVADFDSRNIPGKPGVVGFYSPLPGLSRFIHAKTFHRFPSRPAPGRPKRLTVKEVEGGDVACPTIIRWIVDETGDGARFDLGGQHAQTFGHAKPDRNKSLRNLSIDRRQRVSSPSDRHGEKAHRHNYINQRKPKKLKIASTMTTAPTSQIRLFIGNRSPALN